MNVIESAFKINFIEVFSNDDLVGYVVSSFEPNFKIPNAVSKKVKDLKVGEFLTVDYFEHLKKEDLSIINTKNTCVGIGEYPIAEFNEDLARCKTEEGEYVDLNKEFYFRNKYDGKEFIYETTEQVVGLYQLNVIPDSFFIHTPSKFIKSYVGKKIGNNDIKGIVEVLGGDIIIDEFNRIRGKMTSQGEVISLPSHSGIRFVQVNGSYVNGMEWFINKYNRNTTTSLEKAIALESEIRETLRGLFKSMVTPLEKVKNISSVISDLGIISNSLERVSKKDAPSVVLKTRERINSIILEIAKYQGEADD